MWKQEINQEIDQKGEQRDEKRNDENIGGTSCKLSRLTWREVEKTGEAFQGE